MSQQFGSNSMDEHGPCLPSLSEPESYTEHQAALDATLFRPDRDANELVLELEAGELRIRRAL
jgi:hypothetical protein